MQTLHHSGSYQGTSFSRAAKAQKNSALAAAPMLAVDVARMKMRRPAMIARLLAFLARLGHGEFYRQPLKPQTHDDVVTAQLKARALIRNSLERMKPRLGRCLSV